MLNLNVGILGHVDSGKTSIAKLISDKPSTACFDKNTQSQERGITIDLGFSSLQIPAPDHLKTNNLSILQFTFVDCPGHASLVKTIIGGAQIIDIMMLVIDCEKGIQNQTAECIVIGEITCSKGIVILNKIDLFPICKRKELIDKMVNKLAKAFSLTKFVNIQIVPFSAKQSLNEYEIKNIINALINITFIPQRETSGPFIMNVDHCFNIKGQGTILTGTLLNGHIQINEELEIPILKISRKIKTIQMYKQTIKEASQGDRIGVGVTQLDSSTFERGLICSFLGADKKVLFLADTLVCTMNKIRYYTDPLKSNFKYHISIGHTTQIANVEFVKISENKKQQEYMYQDALHPNHDSINFLAILHFDVMPEAAPIVCAPKFLYIASRLDLNAVGSGLTPSVSSTRSTPSKKLCRLAFYGFIKNSYLLSNDKDRALYCNEIANHVYKIKTKIGILDKLYDSETAIVKSLFKRESSNIVDSLFANFKVDFYESLPPTDKKDLENSSPVLFSGQILSTFGQSGKIKVSINTSTFSTNENFEIIETINQKLYPLALRPYLDYIKKTPYFGKAVKSAKLSEIKGESNLKSNEDSQLPKIWCMLKYKRYVNDKSKKPYPF